MLNHHRINQTGFAVQASWTFIQLFIQCATTNTVAKKNCENPGSRIVRCLHCNRAMLLKNCRLEMNINFHLEKQEQHLSVTAFPKIVGNFLSRGNFSIQGQHWRLDREVVVAQKCWVLSFLRITKLL